MINNIKTNFSYRLIRSLLVLSLSAGIYIFYLYYIEIINSLKRREYLIWMNCASDARSKVFNESLKEGWNNEFLISKSNDYVKKTCLDKPKKWKFQF